MIKLQNHLLTLEWHIFPHTNWSAMALKRTFCGCLECTWWRSPWQLIFWQSSLQVLNMIFLPDMYQYQWRIPGLMKLIVSWLFCTNKPSFLAKTWVWSSVTKNRNIVYIYIPLYHCEHICEQNVISIDWGLQQILAQTHNLTPTIRMHWQSILHVLSSQRFGKYSDFWLTNLLTLDILTSSMVVKWQTGFFLSIKQIHHKKYGKKRQYTWYNW
jgi:hypothetical protein